MLTRTIYNSRQVSLAPKAVSAGGETDEEKISKQADLLSEQVPKAFNIKVRRVKMLQRRAPGPVICISQTV